MGRPGGGRWRDRAPSAALFAAATLIWGSTWLGIKYQLGVVAPEISVVYRFVAAGALLALWCAATGRSLRFDRRAHAFLAAQGGLMFGLNYAGVYIAEVYATSGLVAVLFSTIVFLNPIFMRAFYRTPLSPRVLVAATLGVCGVALLFLPDLLAAREGGNAALGIAFGLGATVIASAGNIVALRNQRAGIPTFPGAAWAMLYGALAVALIALVMRLPWALDTRPAYWWSFAYLVVFGTIAAFGAYLTLMKKVGPGLSAFVGVATPVVALVLSTLFEGYRWTGVAMAGVVLAVVGNLLALPNPPWRRMRWKAHSNRSPKSAISFFQPFRSASIIAPSRCGAPATISTPSRSSRARVSGCARSFCTSAFTFADHVRRRARRRNDAPVIDHVGVAHAFLLPARHVRHLRDAPAARHRQHLHAPLLHLRQRGGNRRGHRLDLAAEEILRRVRDSAIGHVDDLHAGARLEELQREMIDAAGAGRAVVELAGLALRRARRTRASSSLERRRPTTNASGPAAIGATGTNCLIGS